MSGIYSPSMLATRQKLLNHAKSSATNAFRTASEKLIQKTAEATSESLGNKIGSKTTKV